MKHLNLLSITCLLSINYAFAQDLTNETDKISYSLGFKTGEHYRKQEIDLNSKQFYAGVLAGFKNQTATLTEQEINASITKLQEQQVAKDNLRKENLAKENLVKGKEFLDKNKQTQGIVVLPSGLQYKVLSSGKGNSPTINDSVTVNYRGTLIDGTEFDNSYKRHESATLQLKQLIKGWQEALILMKPGDKWRLFVPSELGYGAQAAGPIQPNSTLIFDIELLKVAKQNSTENKQEK
jgi:FKBP-type peptidyl-prolyl cis-trans isomerase FklB